MNRLTQKDDQGNWSLKGVPWMQLYVGVPMTREVHEKLYGALWKLMEYEGTGLDPGDIERMQEELQRYRQIGTVGVCDGYKIHSQNISTLHDCNDCGREGNCEIKPQWGEYCRINCFRWEKGEDK